jgi:hypothetical protein
MKRNLARCQTYMTVAKTLPDLRRQDEEMYAAGFVKSHREAGFSDVTREFYQKWHREVPFSSLKWSARRDGLVAMRPSE